MSHEKNSNLIYSSSCKHMQDGKQMQDAVYEPKQKQANGPRSHLHVGPNKPGSEIVRHFYSDDQSPFHEISVNIYVLLFFSSVILSRSQSVLYNLMMQTQ